MGWWSCPVLVVLQLDPLTLGALDLAVPLANYILHAKSQGKVHAFTGQALHQCAMRVMQDVKTQV
jgi:hypothetical protein